VQCTMPGMLRPALRRTWLQATSAARAIAWESITPRVRSRLAERQLLRVLRHAGERVPFYRRRLQEAGIGPRDLRSAADLRHLPVTTSQDIRNVEPRELVAEGTDTARCRIDRTSATSGSCLTVYLDPRDQAWADAVWIRSYAHMGLRPGQRRVLLESPDPLVKTEFKVPLRRLLRLPVPAIVSSVADVDDQLDALRRHAPQVLNGRMSAIVRIARRLEERALVLGGVELVVVGGEPLQVDAQELVHERMGVWPRRVYGTTEVGFVAWECARGAYHVNSDHVWCELVGDGSDGRANLVVTTLHRRAMPQLRFATGDVVQPASRPCDCGSSWPVLGELLGRETSFLRGPSGRLVSERQVAAMLARLGGSDRFRVVQRAELLDVFVHEALACSEGLRERVTAALRDLVGDGIEARMTSVAERDWWAEKQSLVIAAPPECAGKASPAPL